MAVVDRIKIGKSEVRVEHLKTLQSAWKNRRLVLFIGAGISQPYGIPTWTDLVLRMFYEEADARFLDIPSGDRPAVASWMVDRFELTPTFLARVIRYRLDRGRGATKGKSFAQAIKDSLYSDYSPESSSGAALPEVANLIQRSEEQGRRIQAVVSFNFDNLLELELRRTKIDATPVYDHRRPDGNKFPIVHVHGYLPFDGNVPTTEIVFTEDEYHQLTFSAFHWSVADMVAYLRNYSVLFIGLSMSDPNLRRLLDATNLHLEKPKHILIRRDYDIESEIMDATERVARHIDPLRLKEIWRRAHAYEREVFKDMGVGVMWVKEHEDIPMVLQELGS
jgi:hypothetical protein